MRLKKVIAVAMASVMMFAMTACGGNASTPANNTNDTAAPAADNTNDAVDAATEDANAAE